MTVSIFWKGCSKGYALRSYHFFKYMHDIYYKHVYDNKKLKNRSLNKINAQL